MFMFHDCNRGTTLIYQSCKSKVQKICTRQKKSTTAFDSVCYCIATGKKNTPHPTNKSLAFGSREDLGNTDNSPKGNAKPIRKYGHLSRRVKQDIFLQKLMW